MKIYNKKLNVAANVFFWLALIGYLIITAYCAITLSGFFDALNSEETAAGLAAVFFVIIIFAYGGIAYLVDVVLSLIGMIMAIVNFKRAGLDNHDKAKKTMVKTIVTTVLPVVTYLAIFVIFLIFNH